MSQKVTYFSAIILLIIFKFSDHLYFEPELETPSIPQKLREICGFRFLPKRLVFAKQCFESQFKDRLVSYPNTINTTQNRIFGGRNVRYRESPWTVQIALRSCIEVPGRGTETKSRHCKPFSSICTGVLLTMKHVLTAGHCLDYGTKNIEFKVIAGNDQSMAPSLMHRVWTTTSMKLHIHPGFVTTFPNGSLHRNGEYDVGVITFDNPIDWERYGQNKQTKQLMINTICLPKPESTNNSQTSFKNPQNATLFGWGLTGDRGPTVLQRGDFLVRYGLDPNYTLTMFDIRGDENLLRPCMGDSGSGVVQYLERYEMRAVLIGIDSHTTDQSGNRKCVPNDRESEKLVPVVNHLEWINERLRDLD